MSTNPTEELVAAKEATRTARRLELDEQYTKMLPWDTEAEEKKRLANLRPLSKKHWMAKKWRRDFLRAGWRRLIANQAALIAEQAARIEMLETSMAVHGIVAVRRIDLLREFSVESLERFKKQWDTNMRLAEEQSDERLAAEAEQERLDNEARIAAASVCATCEEPLGSTHCCRASRRIEPVANTSVCATCEEPLGSTYYPDVPDVGDQCLYCYETTSR